MGLLRKIKKAVKKVAKVALKTAPIWSSFVPGGGFAMTLVRQGLKLKTAASSVRPAIKNRFPLPNPYWQGGPAVSMAQSISRVPVRGSRGGPFATRRGMGVRMRQKTFRTTRARTIIGRRKKAAHMRRIAM